MSKMIRSLAWVMAVVLMAAMLLAGCGSNGEKTARKNKPLTVYLWDTDLIKDLTPYIHEQMPDKDIEFIAGNNDLDLYNYFLEHGELPDIITVRRFAGTDAKDLQPYLLDFMSYDVVSEYSSYALQYYKNSEGEVNWLPICGIPQTIIANKDLFDQYGLELPRNYQEYVHACQVFAANGIKPYALDLAEDWSSHEMIQAGGIGELTSLEGISWRSQAEGATGDIAFEDDMWQKVMAETDKALRDSGFTQEDLSYNTDKAMALFVSGKAAMFHGSPVHMKQCQEQMKAQLVRLPYFSQTTEEGFIYMTPSLHVALNKDLESQPERLNAALQVLECMLSEDGQKLIANGGSVISFNPKVPSMAEDMAGLENEILNSEYYIRYSSQKSFAASVKAIQGLLTGTMTPNQAYEAFKAVINSQENKGEESTVNFANSYGIAWQEKGGRPAASAMLNTVRENVGAQLALSPYYYFTSSIYQGECNASRLNLMIANKPDAAALYLVTLTGAQVKELVEHYLNDMDNAFHPLNRYELPIASGMKLIVHKSRDSFELKEIMVEGKPLADNEEYELLLADDMAADLEHVRPGEKFAPLPGVNLSTAWTKAVLGGGQPAAPEEYIELQK